MGNDFRYEHEARKIACLIFLILASLLALQYFDLPNRDYAVFSLSHSEPGRGAGKDNEKTTSLEHKNRSEVYVERITSIAPEGSCDGSCDLSSVSDIISPSPSITRYGSPIASTDPPVSCGDNGTVLNMAGRNSGIAPSPSTGYGVPVVSPSQLLSPRTADLNLDNGNRTSWKGKHGESPPPEKKDESPSVVTVSEMDDMLIHSLGSSHAKIPLWASGADQELIDARLEIEQYSPVTKDHRGLNSPVFRNISLFLRSYEVMEEKLKIYIYKDGKGPVFRHPKLTGIYASEGWFMKQLQASDRFLTSDPGRAHLFYLPFSSQLLVDFVYVKDSHTFREIDEYLKKYMDTIKTRYSFWNRTDGGDHFLVACHDWAPTETRELMSNCIRALCNSDIKEGFRFGIDVSLPETYVHSPKNPSRESRGGGKRKILAFFAGQMHGYVRPILLRHWQNKDPSMKIFGKMRKGYEWHMKNSKYCICAKGYEVNSPRVVEAIMNGCVPVIISDGFVPPFFGFLKWDSFAVFVLEKDIPNLKDVLLSIPERRYNLLQRRGKMVRRHFLWHGDKPVKYDIFHMILHSIWYNRVLQMAPKLF